MTTVQLSPLAPTGEATLRRRVRLIVAATITYNVIEGIVAITAGSIAGSAALVGVRPSADPRPHAEALSSRR